MKNYTKPVAEKVEFEFNNQIVASGCRMVYENTGAVSGGYCPPGEQKPIWANDTSGSL
ncbi:MAG: hypothetical protein HUJ76_09530 [Parasporobacterium sp.]|nr:hypothetical protein [Parasporobacterium sp.]